MEKEKNRRLWIMSELFFPEETSTSLIILQIANRLCEKYSIKVLCGNPIYSISDIDKSVVFPDKSIEIKRINHYYINKDNLFKRTSRAFFLSFEMVKELYHKVKPEDTVLVITNPVILLLFIALLKSLKHFRYCILVNDVFPENCLPAGIFSSKHNPLFIMIKSVISFAYKQADIVITCGRDMSKVIEKKINRNSRTVIKCITNWADVDRITPSSKITWHNKIVLKFAGNLGRVQGLLQLLEIIKEINNNNLLFVFQGSGAMKCKMEEMVLKEKIMNVKFLSSFSRSEEPNVLNDCDIGLVSLDDRMEGLGVPSKTYNLMAAGKPILYIGNRKSEISKMVLENEIGYSFSFNQKAELVAFLDGIGLDWRETLISLGKSSRKVAELKYSESKVLQEYLEIV